ncbi:hypothetical protein Tco_1216344 [Tanacetum coccineum]
MKRCIAELPMETASRLKEELVMYLCAVTKALRWQFSCIWILYGKRTEHDTVSRESEVDLSAFVESSYRTGTAMREQIGVRVKGSHEVVKDVGCWGIVLLSLCILRTVGGVSVIGHQHSGRRRPDLRRYREQGGVGGGGLFGLGVVGVPRVDDGLRVCWFGLGMVVVSVMGVGWMCLVLERGVVMGVVGGVGWFAVLVRLMWWVDLGDVVGVRGGSWWWEWVGSVFVGVWAWIVVRSLKLHNPSGYCYLLEWLVLVVVGDGVWMGGVSLWEWEYAVVVLFPVLVGVRGVGGGWFVWVCVLYGGVFYGVGLGWVRWCSLGFGWFVIGVGVEWLVRALVGVCAGLSGVVGVTGGGFVGGVGLMLGCGGLSGFVYWWEEMRGRGWLCCGFGGVGVGGVAVLLVYVSGWWIKRGGWGTSGGLVSSCSGAGWRGCGGGQFGWASDGVVGGGVAEYRGSVLEELVCVLGVRLVSERWYGVSVFVLVVGGGVEWGVGGLGDWNGVVGGGDSRSALLGMVWGCGVGWCVVVVCWGGGRVVAGGMVVEVLLCGVVLGAVGGGCWLFARGVLGGLCPTPNPSRHDDLSMNKVHGLGIASSPYIFAVGPSSSGFPAMKSAMIWPWMDVLGL